jgi:hypothetical protein
LLLATVCFHAAAEDLDLEISKDIVTRSSSLNFKILPNRDLDKWMDQRHEAQLKLTWTDSLGRTVAVREENIKFDGQNIALTQPLTHAVTLLNFLEVQISGGGKTLKSAKKEFIVTPEGKWDDYQIFMYYPYKTPAQQLALRDLGINTGQLQSGRTQQEQGGRVWWENNYRFYCDQIAYDFFANYHSPKYEPKDKLLKEAKAAYKADPTNKESLFRHPCFYDTDARVAAMARFKQAATAQMRYKPFFYATDETGVANLVEAFDFCYDPRTLAEMRKWLIQQYGPKYDIFDLRSKLNTINKETLDAINKEWGTKFEKLDDVVPLTTDEMMARGDENYSSWADHRTFMNITFANAVKESCETLKTVDPEALGGLVGCQMPAAFGGYDYWRLSQSMEAIEPYNIGNNREIWRSFKPNAPAVTTGFGASEMEVWRLWYQLLRGDRGVIIYDEKNSYLTDDAKPTDVANKVAPTYRELTGGICKQLLAMERINDPIAIHYSQASINAHWMIERKALGKGAWLDKGSWHERRESDFLRLRQSVINLLEDNHYSYTFVSYEQLENGDFDKMDTKVMILPQSIAMSKAECDALRRFVARGGTLIADCRTALMDEHCKMLEKGQLDDLFGIERTDMKFAPGPAGLKELNNVPERFPNLDNNTTAEPGVRAAAYWVETIYRDSKGVTAGFFTGDKGWVMYLNSIITDYHRWRLKPPEGDSLRTLFSSLLDYLSKIPRQYSLKLVDNKPAVGAGICSWRSGDMKIVAVYRNYGLRVNELGPPEYQKQDALEVPMELKLDLGGEFAVYNTREGKFLGKQSSVTFPLDKYVPTIFALLPKEAGELKIKADDEAKCGDMVEVKLQLKNSDSKTTHAFDVGVTGPDGNALRHLDANILAPGGKVEWKIPFALSDKPGEYTLHVRDVATGTQAERKLILK